MRRADVLDGIADLLDLVAPPTPSRVAIDGRDAAGKTTLADELAATLAARGREAIRASCDGFHRARAERHARGEASPEGYYRDAFDYEAIERELLEPLSPDGDRCYRTAVLDLDADAPVPAETLVAAEESVLLFDGVFLLRPELRDAWDLSIFVSVRPEETIRRIRSRDAARFGSAEAAERRYRERYLPAHELYDAEVAPLKTADVVVGNDDPESPSLVLRLSRAR